MYGYIKFLKEKDHYDDQQLFTISNFTISASIETALSKDKLLDIASGLKSFSGKYDEPYKFEIGNNHKKNTNLYENLSLSAISFSSIHQTALQFTHKTNLADPFKHSINLFLIAETAEINTLGRLLEQWITTDADYLVWSCSELFVGDRYAHADF